MNKQVSRLLGGLVVCSAALSAPAHAVSNLVTNGGFETGDFSGWTESGDTMFDGVQCAGAGDPSVYAGNCSAYFGPVVSIGSIAQTVGLGSAGQAWNLSFALMSDGAPASSFSVQFGGQTLLSLSSPSAAGYMGYQFTGVSTTPDMLLTFNFYSPQGYLSLDGVTATVAAVPEPATVLMMAVGLVGLGLARRRSKV